MASSQCEPSRHRTQHALSTASSVATMTCGSTARPEPNQPFTKEYSMIRTLDNGANIVRADLIVGPNGFVGGTVMAHWTNIDGVSEYITWSVYANPSDQV